MRMAKTRGGKANKDIPNVREEDTRGRELLACMVAAATAAR